MDMEKIQTNAGPRYFKMITVAMENLQTKQHKHKKKEEINKITKNNNNKKEW